MQIGVMGSTADLRYAKTFEEAAEKLGELIAARGAVLVFGAEKDFDSLSTAACRGAKRNGGITLGVTYGRGKDIFQREGVDIVIPCGLERGGGREFVLVSACDAIIAIAGGSGTLNEICVAYQLDIPIVVLRGFGGWAEKLAGEYLDPRKRRRAIPAGTPEQAVDIAMNEAQGKAAKESPRGMRDEITPEQKDVLIGWSGDG